MKLALQKLFFFIHTVLLFPQSSVTEPQSSTLPHLSLNKTHLFGCMPLAGMCFSQRWPGERKQGGLFNQGVTDLLLKEAGPLTHTHRHTHIYPPYPRLFHCHQACCCWSASPNPPCCELSHCNSKCRVKSGRILEMCTHPLLSLFFPRDTFSTPFSLGPSLVRMHRAGLRRCY